MPWKIVDHNIGRAGGLEKRSAKQKEWTQKYGKGWKVGYFIKDLFIDQEKAYLSIYVQSYRDHFQKFPSDLEELIDLARELTNPHSKATTGVDLQVPAIERVLKEKGLSLQGKEIVDIGSWQKKASHKISIRLSPLHIQVTGNPKMTLEKFWQSHKCLAIWQEDE